MDTILYYEGLKDLYNRLSDSIQVALEEIVFCFVISVQSGYFESFISDVKKHLLEVK